MGWEDTPDRNKKKTLGQIASELKEAGFTPIILRWKKALRGQSQNAYGFVGCKTWTGEKLDGTTEVSGEIDPKDVCTFWWDKNNVGWALLPKCPRNVEVLAATLSDPSLPFTCEDVEIVKEAKALAAKWAKETPKPREAVTEKKTLAEVAAG